MRPAQMAPVGTLALAATLTVGVLLAAPDAHAAPGPASPAVGHHGARSR